MPIRKRADGKTHHRTDNSEGLVEGKLREKHHILIRQLELKYTLSEDETELILSITDNNKLDAALDAFVFSENKEGVLELLQGEKG